MTKELLSSEQKHPRYQEWVNGFVFPCCLWTQERLPTLVTYLKHTQSRSKLERPIFLEPVKEFNLPHGKFLRAQRPLNGIPEADLHWFLTYRDHYMKRLAKEQSKIKNCILFKRYKGGVSPSIVILHADDSLRGGTELFIQQEDESFKILYTSQEKF